LIGRIVQW